MAGDNQQFCLRWNNHQSTLISVFDSLLESGTLVDCTLAAEGQYLKAHKVVLSACSPYLEALLSQHYEKHPIVILKDVKFQELKSMMDYMYRGEVNITQDQLATFLKAAESLQIKGLSESSGGDDARDVGSTAKRPREEPPPRRPVNPHPQARLPHSSGLTIEPRRSIPHSSEMAPESPMKSREGSTSPVARKRRRRRPSTGEDASNAALSDSQLETSNSCDLPPISNQAQSTPISVPSILATPSASNNQPIESDQPLETDAMNRFPNTPGGELMVKTKMEPNTDQLIEPKTEYLDDINNEDSVEDLTLDDDDEMPGPSHADGSNQNFSQWQMSGDRSTDEVFMAAQEAVGAHRDSQEDSDATMAGVFMVNENSKRTLRSRACVNSSYKGENSSDSEVESDIKNDGYAVGDDYLGDLLQDPMREVSVFVDVNEFDGKIGRPTCKLSSKMHQCVLKGDISLIAALQNQCVLSCKVGNLYREFRSLKTEMRNYSRFQEEFDTHKVPVPKPSKNAYQDRLLAISRRFPLRNSEALRNFDEELAEDPALFADLINYLDTLGTSINPSKAARTRIRKMLTRELLANHSWKGQATSKGPIKDSLSSLRITEATFRSVQNVYEGHYDKGTVEASLSTLLSTTATEMARATRLS